MTNPLDTAASADADRLDPRVDLAVAIVFFVAGAAICFQAWNMPTFRERGGDVFTAPGIVPGFYGIVIAFLASLLGARAVGRKRRGLGATSSESATAGLAGLALVIVLCLAFAVGLVTRLPFWLASAIFVSTFIAIFEWRSGVSPVRVLAIALAIGLSAGLGIAFVFEKLFLVRLP